MCCLFKLSWFLIIFTSQFSFSPLSIFFFQGEKQWEASSISLVLFRRASDAAASGETEDNLMMKLFDATKMFFQPLSRVLKTMKQQFCGISHGEERLYLSLLISIYCYNFGRSQRSCGSPNECSETFPAHWLWRLR